MKKKPKNKTIIRSMFFDWKAIQEESLDDIKRTLKGFGLYSYSSPMCDGQDMYGLVISNKKLSLKEIKRYENKMFGHDTHEDV